MNFYKHHLGDYEGATAHLSWDEDMAYSRLMRVYYRRESPIPDVERYRLTRATSKAQRAAVDAVLAEFFLRDGDVWRQKRCDEEIAAYQRQSETNRRIARGRTVNESFNEPSTNRIPNQKPDTRTKNQKPEPEARDSTEVQPVPTWLQIPEWEAFQRHRRELKKPLRETGMRELVKQLAGFRADGYDISKVLSTAIANGWQGVFPPSNGKGRSNADSAAEAGRRIFGDERDVTNESERL